MKNILTLLFLTISTALFSLTTPIKGAILDAKVELLPAVPSGTDARIIQPGSPIIVSVKITNSGVDYNEQGYFFVRFTYPNPLARQAKSELFITEKVSLPKIAPGKEAFIAFATTQQSPSLFDFIRQDYGMRQYQAVAVIDNKEFLIGNATITFSAYYYAGPHHELPTEVPAAVEEKKPEIPLG